MSDSKPVLKIEAETTLNHSYLYFHRKVREPKAHGRLLHKL